MPSGARILGLSEFKAKFAAKSWTTLDIFAFVCPQKQLGPANCTINRCVAMLEDNTVEWIPPEHCPPRSRELAAGPPKKRWLPDAQGIVKERSTKAEPTEDIHSVMDLNLALQRRGLALQTAGVISYEAHDMIRGKLISSLSDDRHSKTSMQQVMTADRKAWEMLGSECALGIRPAGGKLPHRREGRCRLEVLRLWLDLVPLAEGAQRERQEEVDRIFWILRWRKQDREDKQEKEATRERP